MRYLAVDGGEIPQRLEHFRGQRPAGGKVSNGSPYPSTGLDRNLKRHPLSDLNARCGRARIRHARHVQQVCEDEHVACLHSVCCRAPPVTANLHPDRHLRLSPRSTAMAKSLANCCRASSRASNSSCVGVSISLSVPEVVRAIARPSWLRRSLQSTPRDEHVRHTARHHSLLELAEGVDDPIRRVVDDRGATRR